MDSILKSEVKPNAFARMASLLRPQDWLALMLLGLHAALVFNTEPWVSKSFLLFHFGSFLLWQPLFQGQQRLYWGQAVLVFGVAALLVAIPSLWFSALWIALLLALIGGQAPVLKSRGARLISLCAGTYLLSILLIWVVPNLMGPEVFPELLLQVMRYALLALIAPILFIRTEKPNGDNLGSPVDLLYSVLLFFLVIVLVLGAFVIRQVNNTDYVLALAETLFVIAALLVALSWMWDPRGGFTGLGHILTRYFLSVGTPFEKWMQRLADIAQHEREPDRFLDHAALEITLLPWISGVEWSTPQHRGTAGHVAKYSADCSLGSLKLNIYTRHAAGPSLIVHMRLLTRLLADYYDAKMREQEQRNNAYMQAIYETGTRLTHDVKNLLQSMRSLCAAAEMSGQQDSAALMALVQRQLPQIAQRLQITLDKLASKTPEKVQWVAARDWWQTFQLRHSRDAVQFRTGEMRPDATLPGELFDSVTENLIQNALVKQQVKSDLRIVVELSCAPQPMVSVTDDGEAVPEHVRRGLFVGPVASSRGLGVGLFQAARQAQGLGYDLSLDATDRTGVRFVLKPKVDQTFAGQ